jgi:GntR family transcriptional regulator
MLRHQKVEQFLRVLLSSPDYGPGERIPSERELAAQLGVNRLTVRRAVGTLVQRGVLESNGTGGTRVAAPAMVRPVDLYRSVGIDRVIVGRGGKPGNRLIHFQLAPASHVAAEMLRLEPGAETVVIRRVWTIDDKPFCVETSHLVGQLVPGLSADDLVAGQSLYALLRGRYGYEIKPTRRTIAISYVGESEARQLGMKEGAPALALRVSVETSENQPIEYTISVNNPDLVTFSTTVPVSF